ncbi:hypothetical protein [Bradyrhizobium sp. LHD-71]|nr:hypothetical protein [Bradyrhizobium sp. LHD-71]MDQ8729446.1 hypothetical protein [Bradyrhizobium sp. LHD-71]
MPGWVAPLLGFSAIVAFLYFAFVKSGRTNPSDRADHDTSSQGGSPHQGE